MSTSAKYQIMEMLEEIGLIKIGYSLLPYIELINPFLLNQNIPYWIKNKNDDLPIPPFKLIHKVTSSISIPWFLKTGFLSLQNIENTLEKNRLSLNNFNKILDFGCGCGRIIRHLKNKSNIEIYGTDYNHQLVTWCKKNLTFANFSINEMEPPLNFPNDFFDFIYAISIFTHMSKNLQQKWIREFSRILKPNGFLFITTHGKYYLNRLTPEEKNQFANGQMIIKRSKHLGTNLCSTFHPNEYVLRNTLKTFKIIDYIPEEMTGAPYQDIYLAQNSE